MNFFVVSAFAGAVDVPEVPLSIQLKDPQDVTVSRGQSATLRCDAQSPTPGLQITWLHNDQPIKSNDSRRHVQRDGSLYFPKLGDGKKSKNLTGEYRCRASVQNVSMLSNPAKLKVACKCVATLFLRPCVNRKRKRTLRSLGARFVMLIN